MIKELMMIKELIIGLLVAAGITACVFSTVDPMSKYRCPSIGQDISLISACASTPNCSFTLQDWQDVTARVAACAYQPPVDKARKPSNGT